MTIHTRPAPMSATTSIKADRTDLDRTDEDRSENDGMGDHTLKPVAPKASENPRRPQGPEERAKPPSARPQREAPPMAAETTDLERRVLAHERILQALIAHITETEPKFLARLSERFSEPMQMVRREHDHTDTDSHAEDFIRAVVRLGEEPARKDSPQDQSRPLKVPADGSRLSDIQPTASEAGIQIRENGGVWEVMIDGHFYGQYMKEEHALAVAKNLT
jgi:hypothetical protein